MRFASVTAKGGRKKNEDCIGKLKRNNVYCFVLADGLGGHGNGDMASSVAVSAVLRSFEKDTSVSCESVYNHMVKAQDMITYIRENEPGMQKIGTTLTVLITDGISAAWGHCGDSRIYRIKGKRIEEITEDHSVAFSRYKNGEIEYSQIRTLPGKNMLMRCLGDEDTFKPVVASCDKLKKNTKFLLCSDGLWETVTEDFMEKSLRQCTAPDEWIIRLCEQRRTNAEYEADNFSAVAVFV